MNSNFFFFATDRVNSISKFQYSRPFYSKDGEADEENGFANLWLERTVLEISSPLPGILRWFPVVSAETYLISPLNNAIETMQNANKWVEREEQRFAMNEIWIIFFLF